MAYCFVKINHIFDFLQGAYKSNTPQLLKMGCNHAQKNPLIGSVSWQELVNSIQYKSKEFYAGVRAIGQGAGIGVPL